MRVLLFSKPCPARLQRERAESQFRFLARRTPSDSAQMVVKLIALSRVLLTKDADVLATVAVSPNGAELLRMLMAATH